MKTYKCGSAMYVSVSVGKNSCVSLYLQKSMFEGSSAKRFSQQKVSFAKEVQR